METRLNLPYYSQWKNTSDPFWQERACAIAALKMVIDYHGGQSPSIDELIKQGVEIDGRNPEFGWKHSAMRDLAGRYGVLLELREYKDEGGEARILADAEYALAQKRPIIVSTTLPKGGSHLVVLTGTKKSEGGEVSGFYLDDPDDKNGFGEGYFMPLGEFHGRFRKLTLFSLGKA